MSNQEEDDIERTFKIIAKLLAGFILLAAASIFPILGAFMIEYWIWVMTVVGGILILCIIGYLCYKVGDAYVELFISND